MNIVTTVLQCTRCLHPSFATGQRPTAPRKGMVYDVILHIHSIEDTRRHGPDGHPLFSPFVSTSAPLSLIKTLPLFLLRLKKKTWHQQDKTVARLPPGTLAQLNSGDLSNVTAPTTTMKKTVKGVGGSPLRCNIEACSSSSAGRETRTAQGNAR
jgi:hypothetical protein